VRGGGAARIVSSRGVLALGSDILAFCAGFRLEEFRDPLHDCEPIDDKSWDYGVLLRVASGVIEGKLLMKTLQCADEGDQC
jgi:hypothetical protein